MKAKLFIIAVVITLTSCSATRHPSFFYAADDVNEVYAPGSKAKAAQGQTRRRCAATTQKGTQCSRYAAPGSSFCWQHKR